MHYLFKLACSYIIMYTVCEYVINSHYYHSLVPDPPVEGSGIIVYANLCPDPDEILFWPIHYLLYDVSLKSRYVVGLLKGYHWMCCDFLWYTFKTEQEQPVQAEQSEFMHSILRLLHYSYHTTDNIVQELTTVTQ